MVIIFQLGNRRNPHLEAVVTSVKLGDVTSVRELVGRGLVSVDTTHRGASLLCLAVCRNLADMVAELCRAGADVNTCYTWQVTQRTDSFKYTVLFIPVQGYTETPLIAAIRLGFESIARILVQSPNIDINIQDSEGKSGGETEVC